jgi:hypothetical protein
MTLMIKILLKIVAFILALIYKSLFPIYGKKLDNFKPIHLCHVYGRYGINSPPFVSMNNAPTVTTGSTTSLANTSFTQGGEITNTGGENPSVRGFVYLQGTSGDPDLSNTVVNESGSFSTGTYTLNITGLTQNTSYRIRAYATNSIGTGFGTTITVVTQGVPTVTTQSVSDIGETTATGNGNVTSDGSSTVTERGVVVNTTGTPTTSDSKFAAGAGGTGVFTASMTSLSADTHYYVRAYAINTYGTVYGSEVEFDTLPEGTDLTKDLNDTSTATDQTNKAIAKAIADTITASDDIDIEDINRVITGNSSSYGDLYYGGIYIPSQDTGDDLTLDLDDSVQPGDVLIKAIGKYQSDISIVSDNQSKTTTKTLAESIISADQLTRLFEKRLSDTVLADDTLNRLLELYRGIQDSVNVTDEQLKSVTKTISEQVFVEDLLAKSQIKTINDGVAIDDQDSKLVTKLLSDSILVSDDISFFTGLLISIADDVSVSDDIARRVAHEIDDSVSIIDTESKSISKQLAYSVVVEDLANPRILIAYHIQDSVSVTDDQQRLIGKSQSDTITIEDERAVSIVKELQDSAIVSDDVIASVVLALLINENVITQDVAQKSITKILQDSGSVSDEQARDISKRLTNIVSISDTIDTQIGGGTGIQLFKTITDIVVVQDNATPSLYPQRKRSITIGQDVIYVTILQGDITGLCITNTGQKRAYMDIFWKDRKTNVRKIDEVGFFLL